MTHLNKRKKRLLELFNSPNSALSEPQLKLASDIIDTYQRQDKILYILRQLKLSILKDKKDSGVVLTRSENQFVNRMMGRQFSGLSSIQASESNKYLKNFEAEFLTQFQHFQELNIPAINNEELLFQSPVELFNNFSSYEEEWREKQTRVIDVNPYDPDEPEEVIYEKDGLYVFDVKHYYSEDESRAMAHCGNQYGNYDQRLLSVRTKVNGQENKWIPHATIILNDCEFSDDGYVLASRTGEIKGYANNCPSEKYHDFIGNFFVESDFINGMNSGGYLPESNLQFSDFSTDVQQKLLEQNKDFISTVEKLVLAGGKVTAELLDEFKENFGFTDNKVTIANYDNIEDYAEDFNLSALKYYANDDHMLGIGEYAQSDSEAEIDLLTYLKEKLPNEWGKIESWAIDRGIDTDIYELTPDGIHEWATGESNELYDSLNAAGFEGYIVGTRDDAYKQLSDYLDEKQLPDGLSWNYSGYLDSPLEIVTTPEFLLENIYSQIAEDCGGRICKGSPLTEASESSDLFRELMAGGVHGEYRSEIEDSVIEYIKSNNLINDFEESDYYGYNMECALEKFADEFYENADVNIQLNNISPSIIENKPKEDASLFMQAYNLEVEKANTESLNINNDSKSILSNIKIDNRNIFTSRP